MAKICINCNKSLGVLDGKLHLKDGNCICANCFKKARIHTWLGYEHLHAQDISSENMLRMVRGEKPLTAEDQMLMPQRSQNEARIKAFNATSSVGKWIKFDDNAKEFIVGEGDTADLFEYSNIIDFELIQNGTSVSKGTSGGAFVGGLLYGTTGAVIGAASNKRTTVAVCSNLEIKITLRDTYKKICYINFINSNISTSSKIYQNVYSLVQNCMSYLKIACDMVQENSRENGAVVNTSNADELRKFKELLDENIITAEEFEAKKRQLLENM